MYQSHLLQSPRAADHMREVQARGQRNLTLGIGTLRRRIAAGLDCNPFKDARALAGHPAGARAGDSER